MPYYLAFLAKPMIWLLFVSTIVQASGIFEALVPGMAFFGLLGLCISIAAGFVLCLMNGRPVTAILGAAILGLYLFQHLVFVFKAGVPPNVNAVVSYLPIVGFVLIAQRTVSLYSTLRILAWVGGAYLAVYVLFYEYFMSMSPADNPALMIGDDVRGVRLRLVLEIASFCIFYGSMCRNVPWLGRAALVFLGITALLLSGSRTYTALFVIIYVLMALRMLGIAARSFLFGIFIVVAVCFLLGIFLPWNPFEFFGDDMSGATRANEYKVAIEMLRAHWLTGVGLWTDFEAFQTYLKTPEYHPLFPSDLGILGPYLVFGLAGMLLYVAATYLCIVPRLPQLQSPGLRALRVNCILCGAYGIISPAIALESASLFLALLIGVLLRLRKGVLLRSQDETISL